jgi:murein DD-endopeptidase MepM/ murein hydrolase activator NlpD
VKILYGQDSLELPIRIVDGKYRRETLHVDSRRVDVSNPADQERAAREKAEVGELYRHVTRQKFWSGRFSLPIKSLVTSRFGTKRMYNGKMKSFHTGLDLRAAIGTPIHAAEAGRVVLAKELFFTGNTVIVDHGYGVLTLYAHMSKLEAHAGDVVEKGKILGLSGKTGRVNGPHLHWQAIVHGEKVNPLDLTKVMR